MGKSEQLSYTITIVDTHVCMFFDSVLEEMLERNLSVHNGKTPKLTQIPKKNPQKMQIT